MASSSDCASDWLEGVLKLKLGTIFSIFVWAFFQ